MSGKQKTRLASGFSFGFARVPRLDCFSTGFVVSPERSLCICSLLSALFALLAVSLLAARCTLRSARCFSARCSLHSSLCSLFLCSLLAAPPFSVFCSLLSTFRPPPLSLLLPAVGFGSPMRVLGVRELLPLPYLSRLLWDIVEVEVLKSGGGVELLWFPKKEERKQVGCLRSSSAMAQRYGFRMLRFPTRTVTDSPAVCDRTDWKAPVSWVALPVRVGGAVRLPLEDGAARTRTNLRARHQNRGWVAVSAARALNSAVYSCICSLNELLLFEKRKRLTARRFRSITLLRNAVSLCDDRTDRRSGSRLPGEQHSFHDRHQLMCLRQLDFIDLRVGPERLFANREERDQRLFLGERAAG